MKARLRLAVGLALIGIGMAQTPDDKPQATQTEQNKEPERWNLFYQATAIGQRHGTFRSPYEGAFSLRNYPERDVSLTTTLYLGLRLFENTQAYINPEIAGGKGFSGVAGIANFPNGEIPRVASATPKQRQQSASIAALAGVSFFQNGGTRGQPRARRHSERRRERPMGCVVEP